MTNPTTAFDSSGNGRDMTYEAADVGWGAVGPFASGLNITAYAPWPPANLTNWCSRAPSTDFNVSDLTIGAWAYNATPGLGSGIAIFGNGFTDIFGHLEGYNLVYNSNLDKFIFNLGQLVSLSTTVGVSRSAWHHIVATYDSVNGTALYIDGTLDNSNGFTFSSGLVGAVGQSIGGIWQGQNIGIEWPGRLTGVFVSPSVLSGGTIAGIAAATTSAAYKSAVLATSPLGLWMLDEDESVGGWSVGQITI